MGKATKKRAPKQPPAPKKSKHDSEEEEEDEEEVGDSENVVGPSQSQRKITLKRGVPSSSSSSASSKRALQPLEPDEDDEEEPADETADDLGLADEADGDGDGDEVTEADPGTST
jgi:hypothetical protein